VNLQFLQDLENLSLDGEAFLAQFLEFLLDRSLENDVRFEPLIPMVAKVLDLRLPITTVTASFALLQATIRQNKIAINNSQGGFQNSDQTFPAQNLIQNSAQNQKSELNNSQISQNSNSANSSSSQNQADFAKTNLDISTNSDDFNQNNSQLSEKNYNSQKEDLQKSLEKTQETFQNVSLSEVHRFLIRQIGSSNEMSLKLLVSDLSIGKIDLEHQIGILTLSSGALLNFLKTKKSLDWIANVLETEFGWKLHLKAEQRESKTILFENTETLIVAKNSENPKANSKNSVSQSIPQSVSPNISSNSGNQTPNQLENQNLAKTEKPKEAKVETKVENNSNNSENPKSVFYSLFWKGQKAPYNLQKVPIISTIIEPPKIDWEDLVADFEME